MTRPEFGSLRFQRDELLQKARRLDEQGKHTEAAAAIAAADSMTLRVLDEIDSRGGIKTMGRSKTKKTEKKLSEAVAEATDGGRKRAVKKEKQAKAATPTAAGPKPPREELCVFAFRLTAEERDAIHQAAGPARAAKFARVLLVAAARGDDRPAREIFSEAVKAVK